jgi:hypothetical protein
VAQLVIRSGKAEGNDFAYKGVLARLEKVEGNYTGPSGTELLSELESLAESVGKKYFWASDSSRNPEILGAGPRPESVNPQSAIRNPQ